MNHLQLFEQFTAELEEALTKGQLAAQSGGKELLNLGQAAAAYVLALENILSTELRNTNFGKELSAKYRNPEYLMTSCFGNEWKMIDYNTWMTERLAEALNIKPGSLLYAKAKMMKMLQGDFQKGGSQALYNVIIDYYNQLKEMPAEDLIDLVNEYLADPTAEKFLVQ